MVCELRREFKFPLKQLLAISELSKATYYYWVNRFERPNKDEMIEQVMVEIRQEHTNAGYRPMVELLKQRGIYVNHKKVQRLMKKLGLRVTTFWHKSRKYNCYKGKVGTVAKNKLHRRFNTSVPHQKIRQTPLSSNITIKGFKRSFISTPILTFSTTK